MIETVGLLTNRDKYLKQNSWIAVLLYGVLCVGALGFLLSWGHVTASIPEAPVGGGRCRDQITCPGTVIFPMCQRSKLDEGSGQNLPTSEPCRITAENQIEYDQKECVFDQCTFSECCIITVVYAQQFSASCGSAALTAAELELGYHSSIFSTMISDVGAAWEEFKGREQTVYMATSRTEGSNTMAQRTTILEDFANINLSDLQKDPDILKKAGIWGTWPKTLAGQYEGKLVEFFMNAPEPVTEVLSNAFQEFGTQWIQQSLRESIHNLRDNERILALVRSPTDEIYLHWIMIRPDGSCMDPAVCGTFNNLETMAAFWVPVFEIHLKLTALPQVPHSLPASSRFRRSPGSHSLSDQESPGSGDSSQHGRKGSHSSGSSMKKQLSSSSLKDLLLDAESSFLPPGPHTWHGEALYSPTDQYPLDLQPASWPQSVSRTGSLEIPKQPRDSVFPSFGGGFGLRHARSMGNLAGASSSSADNPSLSTLRGSPHLLSQQRNQQTLSLIPEAPPEPMSPQPPKPQKRNSDDSEKEAAEMPPNFRKISDAGRSNDSPSPMESDSIS